MIFFTCPLPSNRPSPLPSMPQLLEMTVRSRVPRRWIAWIRFSGMPHRPKPPAIRVAPSARSATASSAEATVLSMTRYLNAETWPWPAGPFVANRQRDEILSKPVVDMAIVTFTTDFGFSDGYVGAMKGVVLSMAPDARLVDITHGIAPQDVAAGAIALAQAAPLFPRGTIHVAVVDP